MEFRASGKRQESVDIIQAAVGGKILFALVAFFVIFIGVGIIAISWRDYRYDEVGAVVFVTIVGVLFVLLGLYAAVYVFRWRIELHHDKLRQTGAFTTVELPINEIMGFRMSAIYGIGKLHIIPREPTRTKFRSYLVVAATDQTVTWANSNLVNLDERDIEETANQFEAESRLTSIEVFSDESRGKAGRWARIIDTLALIIAIWVIAWPRPYEYAILALIAVSVAALGSLAYFKGALYFDQISYRATPGIFGVFLLSALGLCIRGVLDWNILEWDGLWVPFVGLLACLLWFLYSFSPDIRKGYFKLLSAIIWGSVYCFGCIITLNGVFDTSVPVVHQASVYHKRVSDGDIKSYYLTLSPWGPRTVEAEVDVSRFVHNRYQIGDEVEVVVRNGRFGIPWYDVR